MQDKKSLGKYISEKRRAANLTQTELADKLYVIPTTISKWERGITYPDITVITALCKELNISEHEFFAACDDEESLKGRRELRKYRTIKKCVFGILNIGYIIGAVTCFICNLVIDRTLSWFFIAALGILISFTVTTVPFYLKNDKYKLIKISAILTVLIYILLFVIHCVNGKPEILSSFTIATFVFVPIWSALLICTFAKIDKAYKVSVCLISIAFLTAFVNPFCERVLNTPSDISNMSNTVSASIMLIISVVIVLKRLAFKRVQ